MSQFQCPQPLPSPSLAFPPSALTFPHPLGCPSSPFLQPCDSCPTPSFSSVSQHQFNHYLPGSHKTYLLATQTCRPLGSSLDPWVP